MPVLFTKSTKPPKSSRKIRSHTFNLAGKLRSLAIDDVENTKEKVDKRLIFNTQGINVMKRRIPKRNSKLEIRALVGNNDLI